MALRKIRRCIKRYIYSFQLCTIKRLISHTRNVSHNIEQYLYSYFTHGNRVKERFFLFKSLCQGEIIIIIIATITILLSLQSYEEAFQTIKEATGIEDIDLLVAKFIEVEDKNFALFNYVNELNNEIELLQEQINEVSYLVKLFAVSGAIA